jgi:hypothetical protein
MANPRQDNKPTQSVQDEARHTVDRTAEEMKRIEETIVKTGEEMARTGAELLRQNSDMVQKSWSFGSELAASIMNSSSEQLGRTLGVSGDEAQKATDRSARNAETLLYSVTAFARGLNGASQEYLDFLQRQFARNMDRINELWRCRSPQDVAAVQTDLVRETVSDLFERNRRIADMSLRLADDAGSHFAQSMEAMRRAA